MNTQDGYEKVHSSITTQYWRSVFSIGLRLYKQHMDTIWESYFILAQLAKGYLSKTFHGKICIHNHNPPTETFAQSCIVNQKEAEVIS